MQNMNRRDFVAQSAAGFALAGLSSTVAPPLTLGEEKSNAGLVKAIQREVIFKGRETGKSWFHPRPCKVPGSGAATGSGEILMTLQTIGGSDYFGPVHWTSTRDLGHTWTEPAPIPALGRLPLAGGVEEGVCDVVPEFHAKTGTVLAIGHTVNYKGGRFYTDQPPRWPIYVVRSRDGEWGERKKLVWDDPRNSQIYSCGCSQRVTLDSGELLIPLTYGAKERKDRQVTSVRATFDGRELKIVEVGSELTNPVGRGLLEPSLVHWKGRFFLTIRAEDNHGYAATSADGLKWSEKSPWTWDNGEPLTMSTTQQHWLPHSSGLFLVYTRKDDQNTGVMRWRAPLFMAQVDPDSLRLVRDTERVALPLLGDGVKDGKKVPYGGNFHTVIASGDESWITDCETFPSNGYRGNTLLARVRWSKPNELAI